MSPGRALRIFRLDGYTRQLLELRKQLIQAGLASRADIENAKAAIVRKHRPKIRINDIRNIDKVSRLLAISENRRSSCRIEGDPQRWKSRRNTETSDPAADQRH